MTVHERLRSFRESLGKTQTEMAEAIGIPLRTYSSYETGGSLPKAIYLIALAAMGCDLNWLLTGTAAALQAQLQVMLSEELWSVERLAFSASAGHGTVVLHEPGETVPVRADLLRRLALRPEYARILDADGESMVPTIHHADPLLIDISPEAKSHVIDNKIYVFTIGDEAFLKRLRRQPGGMLMISDNKDFPERSIPTGEVFRIAGRVRWGEREL